MIAREAGKLFVGAKLTDGSRAMAGVNYHMGGVVMNWPLA